jgi:DNA replication and repair protein RecF
MRHPDHGERRGAAVRRLTLTDFRCYGRLRLDVESAPVVLTGPNGAGKTNLLEAISFLVPGRGLRRARLAEVVRRAPGEDDAAIAERTWAVAARVETPDGTVDIGTGREIDPAAGRDRRVVRIDGQPARGQGDLASVLSAVWLTPQMDGLFREGAPARRRFLDRLVYGFDPAHAGRLAAWERALRERARLLREGRGDAGWLAALEETMAEKGVAVTAARQLMAARLDRACADAEGPFPRASVALAGALERQLETTPALAAEEWLRARLAEGRRRDAEHGGAVEGPHRSDLVVRHMGRDMPADQCSTGEQKTLLIALVLADARLQARERGAPPLLLLDEVVAHLDAERRAALFDEVRVLGAQAWMTGTDVSLFEPLDGHARFLTVRDAAVAAA